MTTNVEKPSEKHPQIDVSKLTDFEISVLIIERDTCQYKAERVDELLNRIGEAKGFVDATKEAKGEPVAVKEETFTCLKFEPQRGAKIGEYAVAFQPNNLPDKWNHAFNILRQNNATIKNRYYGEGYAYAYWLYGEGKIYRKRRGKQKSEAAETKPETDSDPAQLFPEDLRSLLSFEQKADTVIIKPRQFLGSENFAEIADVVRQHGGEWVSAGKDSHFKIPLRSDGYGSTT